MLWLLIGDHRQGKTTTCRRLVERVRQRGIGVGGIVQPAVCADGLCTGYEVLDIASGGSLRLAEEGRGDAAASVGRFGFLREGLAFGRAAIAEAVRSNPRLLIVDEVGPLELRGGGWAEELDLACRRDGVTLLTVRRHLREGVIQRWGSEAGGDVLPFDLITPPEQTVEALLARLDESA